MNAKVRDFDLRDFGTEMNKKVKNLIEINESSG